MSPSTTWRALLDAPQVPRHVVHLYRDGGRLPAAVASWFGPTLASGGSAVMIGTPEHVRGAEESLLGAGVDVLRAKSEGRLVTLDAHETLKRFMVGGAPAGATFKRIAREVLPRARAASVPGGEVLAWGEMVDILWRDGRFAAARSLEDLWNDVIDEHDIRLLCSYRVDHHDLGAQGGAMGRVCCAHDRVLPELASEGFDSAFDGALEAVFGDASGPLKDLLTRRPFAPMGLPPTEAALVRLYALHPETGDRVLAEARRRLAGPPHAGEA